MRTSDLIKVFADVNSAIEADVVLTAFADQHVVEEFQANGTIVLVLHLFERTRSAFERFDILLRKFCADLHDISICRLLL